jgi:hypothetical protein
MDDSRFPVYVNGVLAGDVRRLHQPALTQRQIDAGIQQDDEFWTASNDTMTHIRQCSNRADAVAWVVDYHVNWRGTGDA